MTEPKTLKERFREKYNRHFQVCGIDKKSSPFVTESTILETREIFDETIDSLVAELQEWIKRIRKVHPKYMPNYASIEIEAYQQVLLLLGDEQI